MARLWPSRAATALAAAMPEPANRVSASNVFELFTGTTTSVAPWEWAAPISRPEAESVPACSRAVDLVASTVAGLPVQRFTPDGRPAPLGWLERPEQDRPRWATFNLIARDLIFDGLAYLYEDNGTRYWIAPQRVGVESVQPDPARPWIVNQTVRIDGQPGAGIDASRLDVFYGWHNGIRNHGARLLRTALALDGAAKRMADTPIPSITLANQSQYELSDTEITELLTAYKTARAQSSIAYVNQGIEEKVHGWNSVEQQLVEARQFTNGQVANLCGVPGHMIAGGTGSSSSLTYANVAQENRAFIDFGLNPVIKAMEATLTAAIQSETPGGFVKFNLAGMLRGNPTEIATIITQLAPLGVLSIDEARQWIDLAPGSNV